MSGKCEKGKIRNPATGRCVKADGLVGLSIRCDTPTTSSPRKSTSRKSASRKSASRKSASKKPSAKTSAKTSPTKSASSTASADRKAFKFTVTVRLYMEELMPGVDVLTGAKFDKWMREETGTVGSLESRYWSSFGELWDNQDYDGSQMYESKVRYANGGKLTLDLTTYPPASVAEIKDFVMDTTDWDNTLYRDGMGFERASAFYRPAGSEEPVGKVFMDKTSVTVVADFSYQPETYEVN